MQYQVMIWNMGGLLRKRLSDKFNLKADVTQSSVAFRS